MTTLIEQIIPKFTPPLDETFKPAALVNRTFRRHLEGCKEKLPVSIALERENGLVSRYELEVFPETHPLAAENRWYVERIVKFLLWQRGGWRLFMSAPPALGEHIKSVYSKSGTRRFDFGFMGRTVFERDFEVVLCGRGELPKPNESGSQLGRHLEGYRIGFDLGASDRKVSAVVNGEAIFSEEVIWEPRKNADPDYHYREIRKAIESAVSKMPRLDAIGGSSAGIIINNRPMVASLFRSVPTDRFSEIRDIFYRIGREFNVPIEVINDGDVTALAGAMSLSQNSVLGVAMGSSEAVGYVDPHGKVTGWLSELAFAPIDYQKDAPTDEWSEDQGVGALYLSQQCVFRLAPRAGIELPHNVTDAEKLKTVQKLLEAGHAGARKIWESMGIYLGYALAHYADFYDINQVLILGRCTSGSGGDLILEGADRVLKSEFPELGKRICVQLPDEKSRRVGQSIAAASLPVIAR